MKQERDDGGKFHIDEVALEQRRAEVVKLRADGYKFRQIGKRLGIGEATAYRDWSDVRDRTKAEANQTVEDERLASLERLDRAILVLMPMVDAGDLDAMDRLDKLEKRRAALLGLDAPARQELSGPEGAPIAIDARRALVERLAGLTSGGAADGAASEDPRKPDGG